MNNESVLDYARQDLDASVWVNDGGTYSLTEDARDKIESVVRWVAENTGIDGFEVHIAGSITSNQYSEKSDIDVHFCIDGQDEGKAEQLNRDIRKRFDEQYDERMKFVGSHKIEIYFQTNRFQDMMSIGCYDFIRGEWMVGPEFVSQDYDPYSEYYDKDMKHVNPVIEDIRNVILEIYELLIVLINARDGDFVEYEYGALKDKLSKASLIFQNAKEFRKLYSSPKSRDEALTRRSSAEWKIADSSFKLMDKYGYLGILREMSNSLQKVQSGENTIEQVIQPLIDVIQNNIMKNPNLQNVDKQLFEGVQEEGLAKGLAYVSIIASMLAVPGVTNAKTLTRNLNQVRQQQGVLKIKDPKVTDAVNKSSVKDQKFGGWTYSCLTNLIAILAYNEGTLDYIKKNANGQKFDDRVFQAIIYTVINRAGGDRNSFAKCILEKDQYFGVKSIKNREPGNYTIQHPGIGYNKKAWEKCNELAVKAIEGTLKSPKDDNGVDFGKRNMIANKKIDDKDSYDAWGKKCDFTIGGGTQHYYGYDKSHDGWPSKKNAVKKQARPSHKVLPGDTLMKIARKYKKTPQDILKKNPQIKNADVIKVGQILYV